VIKAAQSPFTAALLDAARPVPVGLIDPAGRPAGKRFDVYRNNVVVGLIDALRGSFPTIAKLIGEENFNAVAAIYVRQFPPTSALMMYYGAEFPGFLAGFEPLSDYGYLPDVARLELALRHAYHDADATPIDPAQLQRLPTDALMAATLHLAPSLRVVQSEWPILSIWRYNMVAGTPDPEMRAEDVLITRPEFDPDLALLGAGAAAFLGAVQSGASFAAACDKAPDLDLAVLLGQLLQAGAITAITEKD